MPLDKTAFKEDDVPAEEFGGNVGEFCSVSYNDDHKPVLIDFHATGVKEFRTYALYDGPDASICIETRTLFDREYNFIEQDINYMN